MSDDPTLGKLRKEIQDAQKAMYSPPFKEKRPQNLTGTLLNVGVELVSGVFVGVGFGLVFDWAFGTSPWGFISLFILGSAAGLLNVYRALRAQEKKEHKKDNHD